MSIDAIGNFLTIIRNGIMCSKPSVSAPHSKLKLEIARILKDEGFIRDYILVDEGTVRAQIQVMLKYVNNESVIHEIKRVSKLGRRVYKGVGQIKPVVGGLGLSILSRNHGLITHKQAKHQRVGGEVICTVW